MFSCRQSAPDSDSSQWLFEFVQIIDALQSRVGLYTRTLLYGVPSLVVDRVQFGGHRSVAIKSEQVSHCSSGMVSLAPVCYPAGWWTVSSATEFDCRYHLLWLQQNIVVMSLITFTPQCTANSARWRDHLPVLRIQYSSIIYSSIFQYYDWRCQELITWWTCSQ